MRIIYIHQYFKLPEDGGAIRSYYITKSFVDKGWKVEVISAWNGGFYRYKEVGGVKIHYLPVKYLNAMKYRRRILAFLRFARMAYLLALRLEKCDLYYISSTPLTTGLVGLWLKKKTSLPYIFEVRDLWPEAPIEMGVVKNKLAIKCLRNLEKNIYMSALGIVALSPGIKEGVLKVYGHAKVAMVPNMSDIPFYSDKMEGGISGDNFGLGSHTFVVSYIGALGKVNDLDRLLLIANECQKQKLDICFLVAGSGGQEQHLVELAEGLGLKNVQFLGMLDKWEVKKLLHYSHASYISFLDLPILETNSPNKFFDALAAGNLVIVGVKGWLKELVEAHQCGIYCDPDDAGAFIQAIQFFIEDRQLLAEYSHNAVTLAKNQFDRSKLTQELIHFVEVLYDKHKIQGMQSGADVSVRVKGQ